LHHKDTNYQIPPQLASVKVQQRSADKHN